MFIYIMSTNCYKILDVSELKSLLIKDSRTWNDFDEQLKTNLCYIYYFQSGQVALLPNNMTENKQGILFQNLECYRRYFINDRFPIDNPKQAIYERHETDLINIKERIYQILNLLNAIVNGDTVAAHSDNKKLIFLIEQLKHSDKKLSLKDRFYTALALGEFLRQHNNGQWILIKYYGVYNPYYVPGILYPTHKIFLLLDDFNVYFDNNSLSLDAFTKLGFVANPGLTLESLKFSKYPNSYSLP
ncbi:MAG: hypothetical protein J0H74_03175 [Chitinophagaceae bacterium]|nr:hypothetical protein [Chitinophagaceae bacterium]